MFSRIVLERLDSRYVVTTRETFYQSDILLTPYSAREETIDADALGAFIEHQYKDAKVDPDEIDTGALILTGVAVRRRNARKIGELFARQAGKMVAVSAGDNLETVMAAYGSGAVARSIRDKRHRDERRHRRRHLQDRGLRRRQGRRSDRRRRRRAAGVPRRRRAASSASRKPDGASQPSSASSSNSAQPLAPEAARALAARMADRLFEAMAGGSPTAAGSGCCGSIRWRHRGAIDQITFSGGVSEYIYGREARSFGDLGALLAQEIRSRVASWGPQLEPSNEGIRATVIGASQYTTQVSGSTIYVSPHRGAAAAQRAGDRAGARARRRRRSIPQRSRRRSRPCCKRLDLGEGDTPVAVFVPWRGSATFQRLDGFCRARSRASPTSWRAAIRWCSPATATSAGSSAFICARR